MPLFLKTTSTGLVGMHGTFWTDDKEATVRQCYGKPGISAAKIAELVGMSRNAVIGKAIRMGLGSKRKPAQREKGPAPAKAPRKPIARIQKPKELDTPPIICDLPPDQSDFACTIHDLTDGRCRYVLGAPDHDAMYCGADVCRGSWCGRHHRLVFTKPERSRDVG